MTLFLNLIFYNSTKEVDYMIRIFGRKRKEREVMEKIRRLVESIQNNNQKNEYVFEDMPKIAEQVLQALGDKNQIPVPIVKVMTSLGFQVVSGELEENISGIIAVDENLSKKFASNKVIAINNLDNLGHQRFTIAHELAHYLFDFDVSNDIDYYNAYDTEKADNSPVEKRANFFAANLLMPEHIFREEFKKNRVENNLYTTTQKLADIFEVSMEAVRRRIRELSLEVRG